MLDIRLFRTNPELIKENIKKKFQDEKLAMVDEVVEMDTEFRAATEGNAYKCFCTKEELEARKEAAMAAKHSKK